MKFTPEQKQDIYELYMKEINDIAEECEWVTCLSPRDVVKILLRVVEKYTEEE